MVKVYFGIGKRSEYVSSPYSPQNLRRIRIDRMIVVIVVTLAGGECYKDSHALVIKPALKEGKVIY